MAILLQNDVVFIHVPKTAGTWVIRSLEQLDLVVTHIGPAHADHERIFNHSGHFIGSYIKKSCKLRTPLGNYLRKCRSFAFVREPLSYYESCWRYLEDVRWKRFSKEQNYSRLRLKSDLWHPYENFEQWGSMSFNSFTERMIEEFPGFLSNLYEKYIPYGSNVVVGKQENLEADFRSILSGLYKPELINKLPKIDRVNASSTNRPQWDPIIKQELIRTEYAAYRRFNYEIPS